MSIFYYRIFEVKSNSQKKCLHIALRLFIQLLIHIIIIYLLLFDALFFFLILKNFSMLLFNYFYILYCIQTYVPVFLTWINHRNPRFTKISKIISIYHLSLTALTMFSCDLKLITASNFSQKLVVTRIACKSNYIYYLQIVLTYIFCVHTYLPM